MERKDKEGNPVPFSLKYVKKSTGQIIHVASATITSSFHGGSVNILIQPSGQIRKLIMPLIIEFNNKPVFI